MATALEDGERLHDGARLLRGLPRGRDRAQLAAELFERVAATPYLHEVVPSGRPDRGFARRVERLGRRQVDLALADLPLALAAHARAGRDGVRFKVDARAEAHQGRAAGELPLGGTSLVLRVAPPLRGLALEIGRRALRLFRGPRLLIEVARADLRTPGAATRAGGNGARLDVRPRIGSSPVQLGPRLVSRARSLRVGAPVPRLGHVLFRALDLLETAWPEARAELELTTELVVPLDEPGTVSYSLVARPGVSFVNVWKKPFLQLVDDLVHEAAHHKLHAVEELEPLVDDAGDARWWSPWRRAWRPLRGIVHACYTFTYGALLFARLVPLTHPDMTAARRRFACKRLLEEARMLAFSLADLRRASRRGHLAVAGNEVRREMTALHVRVIAPASRRARQALLREAAGRAILARERVEAGRLADRRGAEPRG